MFKVQKKDRSLQDFDKNKIVSVIQKAGGPEDIAQKIASQIEGWLPSAAVNEVIDHTEIWKKVLELLRESDIITAGKFSTYTKGLER